MRKRRRRPPPAFWIAYLSIGAGFALRPHEPWEAMLVVGMIVSGVMIIWTLIVREGERKGRAEQGHCLECGYDLRATPQRCPECGAIPRQRVRRGV